MEVIVRHPTKQKKVKMRSNPRGFHTIPEYPMYAVNREGIILNKKRGTRVRVKDLGHWSGRVTLYKSTWNGGTLKRTLNVKDIVMSAFRLKTDKTIKDGLIKTAKSKKQDKRRYW